MLLKNVQESKHTNIVIIPRETWKTHLLTPEIREKIPRVNYSMKYRAESSSLASIKWSLNEIKQYRDLLPKNIAELKYL